MAFRLDSIISKLLRFRGREAEGQFYIRPDSDNLIIGKGVDISDTSSHVLVINSTSGSVSGSYTGAFSGSLVQATEITGSTVSASNFFGDGTGITGVTAEWDGSHTGNASITGSLYVTENVGIATGNEPLTSSGGPSLTLAGDDVVFRMGANIDSAGGGKSTRIEFVELITDPDTITMDYGAFIHYDGDAATSHGLGELLIGVRNNSTTDTNVLRIDRDAAADMVCLTNDGVGIGTSAPNNTMLMTAETSLDGYVALLSNTGSNTNRKGIVVRCGEDSGGDGTLILFQNATPSTEGSITFSAGAVAYNSFTGVHIFTLEDGEVESYSYGTIIKVIRTESASGSKQPEYFCKETSGSMDTSVIGVYGGDALGETVDKHQVFALGDGHIRVNDEGGDIDNGDYICPSTQAGVGMKQSDDLLHNYTVAKSTESVVWSEESESEKLISCTYHCG